MERVWIRIFAEAGFPTVPKPLLRDCNIPLHPRDARQLDFRAGAIDGRGLLTCADVTVVSALDGKGRPHGRAADADGVALAAAEDRKADKYPELAVANPFGVLTVLAAEIAGRWNPTTQRVLAALVRSRVQRDPPALRNAAAQAWAHRWGCMLAVALQKAVAISLLDAEAPTTYVPADAPVHLADVLADAAWCTNPPVSRLPWRE